MFWRHFLAEVSMVRSITLTAVLFVFLTPWEAQP
jgi:hypothetical protein